MAIKVSEIVSNIKLISFCISHDIYYSAKARLVKCWKTNQFVIFESPFNCFPSVKALVELDKELNTNLGYKVNVS